ncbi:MAG: exopolysaccharide biosynthesis protein [Pseudomonadota bacterium]
MSDVHDLQSLFDSLLENTTGDTVTVRDLLDAVGRRSYGPILFLLGFVAISPLTIIPGANWLVALVVLIVSVQIIVGRNFPWVPSRALDFTFKREHLTRGIDAMRKHAHTVDRLVAPRFTVMTEPPFVQLIGLICVGAALATFPLGLLPLGPLLPGLTILLFGLGLTARDGVLIALAGACLTASIVVLTRIAGDILSLGLI